MSKKHKSGHRAPVRNSPTPNIVSKPALPATPAPAPPQGDSQIVQYSLSLTVRSPFLFPGLLNGPMGVDVAALRNTQGKALIAGEQVRGVLAAALTALSERAPKLISPDDLHTLFGAESGKAANAATGEQDRPERGKLYFSELIAESTPAGSLNTRIEIDDDLGSVKQGALQVVELVAPIGQTVCFSGRFSLHDKGSALASRFEAACRKALALIPAIGACKSAGFGEITATSLSTLNSTKIGKPAPTAWVGANTRLGFRVQFDRPILVNASRLADNVFISSTVIPGSVLKGALAERLQLAGIDPENAPGWTQALAALHISHAWPLDADGKEYGKPLPNSVLHTELENKQAHFGDALLAGLDPPEAETGFGFMLHDRPAAFPIDWKPSAFEAISNHPAFAKVYSGGGDDGCLPDVPRMHVRIDRENLTAATGALFATIAKSHLRTLQVKGENCTPTTRQAPQLWQFSIDLHKVEPSYRQPLQTLLADGLSPVGSTGAEARFTPCEAPTISVPDKSRPQQGAFYAVTLMTPAAMIDPLRSNLTEQQHYAAYWQQVCGARLRRFFASRELAGGYIATRRRLYGSTYYPFVLTSPGSVFLLQDPDLEKLEDLLQFGLPPVAFYDAQGAQITATWRNCPWLPEAGYGQIIWNAVDHAQLTQGVARV